MQEAIPELVGLTVPDSGTEHFAGAISGNASGHDQGVRDHMRTDTDFAERRVSEHVRELGVGQRAGTKRLHFGVELGADAGYLRLRDASVHAESPHEIVHAACRDPVYVGLHDHRVQGPVDAPATLKQSGEERPGT